MSSQSIKIALAQMCPINAPEGGASEGSNRFSNLEQNLLKARDWVEEASESGADVVVLPEYFLQGLVDNGRQVRYYHQQISGLRS
jgi:predicted amidohydrolase